MKLSWIHAETTTYNIHSKICNGTFSQHECWKNPQFLQIGLPYKRGKTFCMFGGNFNSLNGFNDFTEQKNRISPKHFFPVEMSGSGSRHIFLSFERSKWDKFFWLEHIFSSHFSEWRGILNGGASQVDHTWFFLLLPPKRSFFRRKRVEEAKEESVAKARERNSPTFSQEVRTGNQTGHYQIFPIRSISFFANMHSLWMNAGLPDFLGPNIPKRP
jgi:hypothetical protein